MEFLLLYPHLRLECAGLFLVPGVIMPSSTSGSDMNLTKIICPFLRYTAGTRTVRFPSVKRLSLSHTVVHPSQGLE